MIWNRIALAASVLAPVALLLDTTLAAAAPESRVEPQTSIPAKAPAHPALPRGVHLKKNGQYVRSLCGETSSLHCGAKQILPGDYVPGSSPVSSPRPMIISVPQSGGLGPTEITAAYNLSTLPPGTGNIVAVVDSLDHYAVSDLAGYRAGYGLPALPTCPASENGGLPVPGGTPCFAAVDELGALHTASAAEDDTAETGADYETALDMDMVSAACPACSILLVQLTGAADDAGNGSGDLLASVQAAAKIGAVAISISLGEPESTDPIFGGMGGTDPSGYTTPGHLVFVASGDFGYDEETACGALDAGCGPQTLTTPSYPASAPDVIAVGGTALYNAGGAGTYTESVWDDGVPNAQDVTTSGCSTEFPALLWQTSQTTLPTTTCKMRATADISAAAAYATSKVPPTSLAQAIDTDIVIYTTSAPNQGINGFSGGLEGTSAASPMLAAIFARIGLAATVSKSIGWPYSNQAAFNDVISGTDDVDSLVDAALDGFPFPAQCTGANLVLCAAGPGWDGPTGVGTPNGAKLLALAGGSPTPVAEGGTGNPTGEDSGPGSPVAPPTGPSSSGGCSCDMMGAGANGFGASALLVGLAALASRRRRAR